MSTMNDLKLLVKCNRCGNELTVVKSETSQGEIWLSVDSNFCECNRAAHRLTSALISAYKESLKEEA